MRKIEDYQIRETLQHAKIRITYSKVISAYPRIKGMRNFDLDDPRDLFYRNVCNCCFGESLLTTAALLDRDNRAMSFYNWSDYTTSRKDEIDRINRAFNESGFRRLRDQVIGHHDILNENNNFMSNRSRGMIFENLIVKLDQILDDLIKEFFIFTASKDRDWDRNVFNVDEARGQVERVLESATPILTNAYQI